MTAGCFFSFFKKSAHGLRGKVLRFCTVVTVNKRELRRSVSPAATTSNEDEQTRGKLCSLCSVAPCDGRLFSEQLLMVLSVNKQVRSDSQQIPDLLRDRLAAVSSGV